MSPAHGQEFLAEDPVMALTRWVDSYPQLSLKGRNELGRLNALLRSAAGPEPWCHAAWPCLPALLNLPLWPVSSSHDRPDSLEAMVNIFGAHPGSFYGSWLAKGPCVGDVGRYLKACRQQGFSIQVAAQTLLTGQWWFFLDARFRALYGSRDEEPIGFVEASRQPGFGADLVKILGPRLAAHFPEGLEALCEIVEDKASRPRPSQRLDLATALVMYACATAGRRPRYRKLHPVVSRHFPGVSEAALRKLLSRVSRGSRPARAGKVQAHPRLSRDDLEGNRPSGGNCVKCGSGAISQGICVICGANQAAVVLAELPGWAKKTGVTLDRDGLS